MEKNSYKRYYGVLFIALFLLVLGQSSTCLAETATDYFNLTSGDLLTIYDIFKGNSITFRKQDSNYNNIVSLWESGEEMLTSKNSSDLDNIADNLNQFMYEKWILSGDGIGANSTSMNDKNIFIVVQPASSVSTTTRQVRFAFIPRDNVQVYLNETGSYNNDPTFSVQPTIYNLSGDGSMTKETYGTSHTIYLTFNSAGDPSFKFRSSSSDLTAFNNGYLFYTRNQETPYINTYVYDIGMLATFRQNSNLSINQVYYKKYNNQQYLLSRLGFRYDLTSETLESGEIIQPTPTPQPTGGTGGGGITQEELTAGMIDANNQYWGTSGELSGDEQIETISGEITGIINSASGELSRNEVFNELDNMENAFLNFFESGHNENYYDLIINWGDVEYSGDKIINSGQINFSQLCREIPALGTIQTTIRTIVNFWIIFSLIKQIYNLILATLGIDNPYLYEEQDEATYNYDDGGTLTETRRIGNYTTRRRIKYRR